MPELTASTREVARRLGVSDTALRKAEQTNASPASLMAVGTSTRPDVVWWRPRIPPARPRLAAPARRARPSPG